MEENSLKNKKDLQGRAFNFAVEITKFLKDIKYSKEKALLYPAVAEQDFDSLAENLCQSNF